MSFGDQFLDNISVLIGQKNWIFGIRKTNLPFFLSTFFLFLILQQLGHLVSMATYVSIYDTVKYYFQLANIALLINKLKEKTLDIWVGKK